MVNKYPTPKKYTAKLVSKLQLNFRITEVTLEIIDPMEFAFIPGQFVSLSVGRGVFRSYSISSSYRESKTITLIIETDHEGAGSNFIRGLSVGDPVEFIGPSGRFCLPETLAEKIVFIVTGTGIAPIFSMLDYLIEIQSKSDMTLYFGARNTTEIFKTDYLENCAKQLPKFDYKLCYSNELTAEEKVNPKVVFGRVTENVDMSNTTSCLYVLCGHPFMIADMTKSLLEKGVPADKILHEKFTVSKKTA